MARKELLKNVFSKGKELADDLVDEFGEYLETGKEYFENLGGSKNPDNVTQQTITNKQNKQAEIETVKKKRKPKSQEFVKTLNYEYILNSSDPLKKQQALDVLENLRKGRLKKFEAEKELKRLFPEKTGMVGDVNYAFTKLKNTYEDARRRSPKFEEDIFDINISASKGGKKPTAVTKDIADRLIKIADADTSSEPFSVKFANAFIKELKPNLGKGKISDTSYPTYKNTANAILKFRNRDDIVDMPTQGKGKVFINDDGTRTVVQGARGGDKSAKELFMEIPEGELVKGYPAQYMKQNVVDASGQTYTKAFNSVTKQNPYVADKLADMRQFFDEDLGQYHFYGLDHIQPLRFGGTNANTNLRFTMEGPHSAVDTLTPNKTLSDIDVKNKSKMEAEIHGLGTDIVDILYEASRANNPATKAKLQEQAITLSQQIKNMTNAFSKTYNKVDFHIGEPYVAVKTGDTAKFIKYSDYVGANNETRNLISQLIPDQFNKPNAGKSIEQQVDEVYTIYADMFNLGGPIKKEAMQQMTNYKDGGPVGGPEPMVDEETGMLDYLSDVKQKIDDTRDKVGEKIYSGLRDYFPGFSSFDDNVVQPIEDFRDAKGEEYNIQSMDDSYKLMPRLIGEVLEVPGEAADFFLNMDEKNNHKLELRAQEAETAGDIEGAEALRNAKVGIIGTYSNPVVLAGKFADFWTMPLQQGYADMFEDTDHVYNPFTGEKFYADNDIKKVLMAAGTIGLTGAELFLAVNPLKMKSIARLPDSKLKPFLQVVGDLVKNVTVPLALYEVKDPLISPLLQEAFGQTDDIRSIVDNAESAEDLQNSADKIEQRNVEGNQLEYAEGGMVDPLPPEFTGEYAETKLAMGGEPGQFSNPTPSDLEEEIDVGDYLLEPAYESVQDLDNIFDITRQAEDAFETDGGFQDDQAVEVASRKEGLKYIFGEVPNWVRQGKERIQMGIEKILPKTGDELEDAYLTRLDEIDEGLTPITKSQPGQLFYSKLEAELMQGPKEYKDVEAFKKYYQSRNIPKIEIIDSELERIIEAATKAGQPISREMVLGALKESPIRYVQSKGYGFLSNVLDGEQRGLKYSGYKEYGAIPNTDRERLLFIDPNDLRGDPGRLPPGISPHDWQEPYTIAWSRLSDRQLGGKFTGKTTTFADEIQSDIFQAAQKTAGKLSAKIKYMAQNNVPLDTINNELQRDMMTFFADKGTVYRESLPGSAQLQKELQALMGLQDQLTALKNTPVPEITDEMLEAAQKVRYQQSDIIDNMTEELNLQLVKQLYPNLPFKLRGQWADASIKRDIYEAAYRKFVLKDPNATDYYAVTPANLVTKRYTHSGSSATSQADRVADKDARIKRWVDGGMEGEIAPSQYPGIGMYEFYGGPGADVVTDTGKHYTSEIEKIMKRIAKENNVNLEVLPVRVGDQQVEVFNVVNRETGEILGTGNTGRQADAIANDIIDNSDIKVIVERANQFDTADSFGIELTPEMAEAFKAYMAKGGYVQEEIVRPYGD